MEEGKTFFGSLRPRSALLVGAVGGVMVICTIGFFILGGIFLKEKFGAKNGAVDLASAPINTPSTPANTNPAPTPTPPPVVTKAKTAQAELFVMSYCPYGLQMEKAYLPVMQLLKNKAKIDIKFVSYSMHGQKELEENTRQYCIQSQQNEKFIPYLNCFAAKGDYQSCLSAAAINQKQLDSCVASTNQKYAIMTKFNDQSTWLSGQYPLYPIYDAENQKYGVQGSPTLVINGAQAEVNRTPEAVKEAICAGFENPPAECQTSLSAAAPAPGFGAGTAGGSANAGCGT